ncbi:uncharacterized protein [Procambarus clarkii]|uniref:uncharacterized protein isoform X2 n=1 Tax=Procambarus clarkii TaxID=6728 RepID=UPI003744978C
MLADICSLRSGHTGSTCASWRCINLHLVQMRRWNQFRLPRKIQCFLLLSFFFNMISMFLSYQAWEAVSSDPQARLLHPSNYPSPLDPSPLDPSPLDKSTLDSSKTSASELYLDPAMDMTGKEEMEEVLDTLPNLPFSYRERNDPHFGSGNNNCSKYPELFDIHFNSIYWQVLQTSNGSFYMYSAFYDNRTLSKHSPSLRILAMINRIEPSVKTKCKIWFNDKISPVIVNVSEYRYIWYKEWGNYNQGILQPYLLECIVPAEHRQLVPQSVSLVEQPCDKPTNNLRVINNQPQNGQKKNFAVCVKGLDFYIDKTVRIVEWLELLFLLGADKVFLYNMGLQPSINKVLKYYERLGLVDVKKLSLPGEQPNERNLLHKYLKNKGLHKRQNEVIPYNDCFYRNMNHYKYIVLLDTDEVIVPKTASDWRSLLDQVVAEVKEARNRTLVSYCARNAYFLDSMQEAHGYFHDIPSYMHLMQHVYRAANYSKPGYNMKCFHDTQKVLTLHNHYPFSCLDHCKTLDMPTEYAHLQHSRKYCVDDQRKICPSLLNDTVLDNTIWRYKEPLIKKTFDVLRYFGFLKS